MTSAAETTIGVAPYPLLRPFTPVLRRSADEVQVGFPGSSALVVVTTEPIEAVLGLLDGRHRLSEIRRRARRLGIAADRVDAWLRLLSGLDLLGNGTDQDPVAQPLVGRQIRLVGAGLMAKLLADELVSLGVSVLHLSDDRRVDREIYPTAGPLASMGEALGALLSAKGGTTIRVSQHWSKPDDVVPDLTIVAGDAPEPDRVIAFQLLRADQPHLFLRTLGAGAVVGPLVVPGQTACLHCTDLTRTDRDPRWPMVMNQLSRLEMAPLPTAARWAASLAITQVLGLLDGQAPQTLSTTVEMIPPGYALTARAWPQHPGCGCGWAVVAE